MLLINNDTDEELELPDELLWEDELKWSPIVMSVAYSLTGAMLLQKGVKQGGRPITLVPPEESMGWVPRSLVESLMGWAEDPMVEMTLSFPHAPETTYNVIFRHSDKAIDAAPIKGYPDHAPGAWMKLTLRLMEK